MNATKQSLFCCVFLNLWINSKPLTIQRKTAKQYFSIVRNINNENVDKILKCFIRVVFVLGPQ